MGISDSSSNESDIRKMEVINRERAVFLKSLSVEPETHVVDLADRLGITRDKAWSFVKNFLRTLSEEYDINNPQKIKDWVNLYVEPELQLSDYDITNLVPLLEKYPDPSYRKASEVNYTSDTLVTSPSNNNNLPPPLPPSQPNAEDLNKIPGQGQQKYDEFGQPERTVADWGQYNVSSLNRTVDLSFLPELTRIGLVRFVLQRVAQPPPNPRVEAFVQNFYLNEDQYMASPDTLRREFRDFFGEKTGEQAAHLFVSFIQNLPPIEHFGVRKQDRMNGMGNNGTAIPMGGGAYNPASPFTAGSQFENPFDTYYHREGVLGYGQDIRSYSAQRAIHEFELQRKRDKEMERRQEKMMSDARSSMQMQMFDFMRQLRAGGTGGGGGMGMGGGTGMDAMFWPMMMTAMSNGRLMMEPYTDAEGKTSMRMISNPVGAMAGQAADPDRVTLRDMIELMNNFNGRIDSKATENQALRDSILQDLRNQIGTTKQMPEQLLEYKKLFQELSPQNQGPWGNANPLDIARVMLEKEKIVGDRQMAEKAIERAANEKKDNQTMEVEKMKEANKTKNVLIKSMTGLLGSTAPMMLNLLLMLTGRQQLGGGSGVAMPGGGGGLGGLMNMVQGLLGGLGGMGGAGGEEGEEGTVGLGGNGGPGNGGMGMGGMGGIFDALGGLFGTKQQPQPSQQNMGGGMNMGGMMPPSQQQDNGGGMGGESYDVNDIMSGIQQMFGMGGNGGQQQQQQQAPIPQTGGMPFMGFGPTGPDVTQQFTAPAAAYNRQPVSGGFGMPANAFEEAQSTAVTEPIFKINTNLPPYQQQYQQSQQQPQQRPQVIIQQPPPQIVQPQVQPQEEQAVATQNEYKIFTEADFANTPKEKLVEYENEARRSFDETQSYLKSIRNVINSSQ